jgi:hypothetical protein
MEGDKGTMEDWAKVIADAPHSCPASCGTKFAPKDGYRSRTLHIVFCSKVCAVEYLEQMIVHEKVMIKKYQIEIDSIRLLT